MMDVADRLAIEVALDEQRTGGEEDRQRNEDDQKNQKHGRHGKLRGASTCLRCVLTTHEHAAQASVGNPSKLPVSFTSQRFKL